MQRSEIPAIRGQNYTHLFLAQGGTAWGSPLGTSGHMGTSPSEGPGLGRASGTFKQQP